MMVWHIWSKVESLGGGGIRYHLLLLFLRLVIYLNGYSHQSGEGSCHHLYNRVTSVHSQIQTAVLGRKQLLHPVIG